MENLRFKALEIAMSRRPLRFNNTYKKISEYFGIMTFNETAMKEYLSKETYEKLKETILTGKKIDRNLADHVAAAIKQWAINKGATHYAHWFHPLTGDTAEKHDAFLQIENENNVIEKFTGEQLIQQEPDASSFPSGGLRNTFEARGYTAWDPTSPVFIIDDTLCIPSVFISYNGEALDYKSPLLKANRAINEAATRLCRYFDKDVKSVYTTLGIEQEFFLVDSALFRTRPDLILTGRTVLGHPAAKDQQLEDNYFGAIPDRVIAFMKELEFEAHKLGIPIKTRHNEVAPNQFECAPIHEETNLAIDHNQLLMSLLKKIANKHNFQLLLHEKPFAGVNGSGKHCNWSLKTDKGENLLSPGKTSKDNTRFLAFLSCILSALNEYPELIRASIASAGNALRLGANEAPPAIISAFIGSQLTKTLEILTSGKKNGITRKLTKEEKGFDIPNIPEILRDNTDRNRTSPFAFTGNKFEFRAVGASANCAAAIITLNTTVADQINKFCDEVDKLINKNRRKESAIIETIKEFVKKSERIRFEGNNYSEEWIKEAAKRNLPNIKETPIALTYLVNEKAIQLFEKYKVLSKRELYARYEIEQERYTKKIQIESRIIGDLSINHIIPTVLKYQKILIENIRGLKELYDEKTYNEISSVHLETIKEISNYTSKLKTLVDEMIEERKKANKLESYEKRAIQYSKHVQPYFDKIRYYVDKLETIVDDQIWPLPKYRELLFIR